MRATGAELLLQVRYIMPSLYALARLLHLCSLSHTLCRRSW